MATDERRRELQTFILTLLQMGALIALAALQDPEIRRNLAWALAWTRERARAIIAPEADEPAPADVSALIEEARRVVRDVPPQAGA